MRIRTLSALLLVGSALTTLDWTSPAPALAGAPPDSLEPVLADLAEDKLFTRSDVGVQIVDLATGEEVFARNADTPLTPASTAKVLTAAAALETLGPAYRFKTAIAADAPPDKDGVIHGNLYVRGGGDPTMVVEKLWKMLVDLDLAGVRKVDGDLVFDDSFFTPDTSLAGWDKAVDVERGPAYFPALSALSINFNSAAIVVRPGSAQGDDADVRLETEAGDHITLVSTVKTGAAGARRGVRLVRAVRDDGGMAFTASGSIPLDEGQVRYYRTIHDPTGHFAAIFGQLAKERGIAVTGTSKRGTTPDQAIQLVENQSPPLAAVLMDMNKFSSNYFAELVLRTVGAEVEDGPGSTASGLVVVRRYLESLGLGDEDFTLVNGSGLSNDARISAAGLNAVLVDMYRDPRVGSEFAASLAIAGWDGTLSDRLEDYAGLVRGKTGTIGGVHCLAGYLIAGTGERYAFSFLVNKTPSSTPVRALHDKFARRLLELGEASVADGADEAD